MTPRRTTLQRTINPRAWLLAALAATAVPAATGCSSSVPRGSPVLLKVYWQVAGQQITVWSNDTDGAQPTAAVNAGPTQFNLVFDRVLDGSKVEDTTANDQGGTGGTKEVPKADPPVQICWPDTSSPGSSFCTPADPKDPTMVPPPPEISTPSFSIDVWYNSIALPNEATTSSYVFAHEVPSYPSNTMLTINLTHTGLTSIYNEPMIGPDSIDVLTAPFTVAVDPPPAAFEPVNYWVPLHFTARPGDETAILPPHVHVTAGGADLPFVLVPEPLDATLIYLQPATGAIWPSGVEVDVTIDAGLPDTFGEPLAAPLSTSFVPCADTVPEGGTCPAPPLPDAGVDAGAPVDAAVDAPTE